MLGRTGAFRRAAAASWRLLETSVLGPALGTPTALPSIAENAPVLSINSRVGFNTHRGLSSLEDVAVPPPRQATYLVEVITGDVRGAGSPAPAAITLYGEGT